MKPRIKSNAIISASPSGMCFMTHRGKLEQKFHSRSITTEELKELATLRVDARGSKEKPQTYTIRVWGKEIEVSREEWEKYKLK